MASLFEPPCSIMLLSCQFASRVQVMPDQSSSDFLQNLESLVSSVTFPSLHLACCNAVVLTMFKVVGVTGHARHIHSI